MNRSDRIFVAGHRGLVGSALTRRLRGDGYDRLILRSREELDLLDPQAVDRFMSVEHPQYVFMAAARVGGILANDTMPADFIRENLAVTSISSTPHIGTVSTSCCSWVAHVSTLGRHLSPSRRSISSRARWNRPTTRTRSRRSPGSNYVSPTIGSTARTTSA